MHTKCVTRFVVSLFCLFAAATAHSHVNVVPSSSADAGRIVYDLGSNDRSDSGIEGIDEGGIPGPGNAGTEGIDEGGIPGLGNAGTEGIDEGGISGPGNAGTEGIDEGGIPGLGNAGTEGIDEGGIPGLGNAGTEGIDEGGIPGRGDAGTEGIDEGGIPGLGNAGTDGIDEGGIPGLGSVGTEGIDEGGIPGLGNAGTEGIDEGGIPGLGNTGTEGIDEGGTKAVVMTGAIQTNPLSLHGVPVEIRGAAITRDGEPVSADSIRAGQISEVSGRFDGITLIADNLALRSGLMGQIQHYDSVSGKVSLLGHTVQIDPGTVMGISAETLSAGAWVVIDGLPDHTGEIRATRIDASKSTQVSLTGLVSAADQTQLKFFIGSQQIDFGAACLLDVRTGMPEAGQLIQVTGALTQDASLNASIVREIN